MIREELDMWCILILKLTYLLKFQTCTHENLSFPLTAYTRIPVKDPNLYAGVDTILYNPFLLYLQYSI